MCYSFLFGMDRGRNMVSMRCAMSSPESVSAVSRLLVTRLVGMKSDSFNGSLGWHILKLAVVADI